MSRTAVSKWESGRGMPNIDSLKAIAKFFSVTIDELLSGEELLSISEEESKQKEEQFRNFVFALLDLGMILFLFLPLFGEKGESQVYAVSLLTLCGVGSYLKAAYFSVVIGSAGWGFLNLLLQSCELPFWRNYRGKISLLLNMAAVLLFMNSLQPYAATFSFAFLMIKLFLIWNKR